MWRTIIAAAAISAAGAAQAATIDFNGTVITEGGFVTVPNGGTYDEDGFRLTSNTGSTLLVDNGTGGYASFDDDLLVLESNGATVTFTQIDGNPFNAESFRLGNDFFGTASVTFTGSFAGGGTIDETFNAAVGSNILNTLSGFNNLTSLQITANNIFPGIDDLVLTPNAAVPLPAAGWLLAAGIAGLFLRGRQTA